MDYKTFEHILLKLQVIEKRDSSLYDLGVDLTTISEDYNDIIVNLFKTHYGEIGYDMISWWLYEDVDKFLYDSITNEKINDLTLMKDLWKYCEELRLDKDFIPYVFPIPLTSEQRFKQLKGFFEK